MPEDNLIDWERVRLNARRMLKDWAEGKQMPTSPRDQEDMPGAPGEISKADMWERAKAAVAGNRGKQMPLYRRRESVTADEVIAQLKRFEAQNRLQEQVMEAVIKTVESTVDEICGKNRIENENATRR